MTAAVPVPLIDELMPRFDEFERHEILVRAAPAVVTPRCAAWTCSVLA